MTTEYTWSIAQLDCYPEHEGHSDVVFTAHWRLTGVDGEYTGSVYGSIGLELDPEAEFTPFEELTKEQVIGWVEEKLGEEAVTGYKDSVAKQIADQANPPVVNPPVPWG